MRAVVMHEPGSIGVTEWPTPQPGAGEVLVAVAATGICAGDLYVYLGKNPYVRYPQICGHEIAGWVAAVGPDVDGLTPGTPVVVEPFIGCGTCYPCRVGRPNCCRRLEIIGLHRPGGFAEYVVAPVRNVHRVPEGLEPERAALTEPVAIAVHACRRGAVGPDDLVLVLGCGPIGLALIEVAQARGARVLATDVVEDRREAARELGAEILPPGEALLGALLDRTEGEGAPVVIEATGNPKAMEQTMSLVAPAGRIVIVGLVPEGVQVSLAGLDFTRKEVTILGSRASTGCFPEALRLLASGRIRYAAFARPFDLWQAPEVFRRIAEDPGSVRKAILVREEAWDRRPG